GGIDDPEIAARIVDTWIGLRVLRYTAQSLFGSPATGGAASIAKLLWAPWHQRLGELAIDVAGVPATEAGDELTDAQRLYLFTRADTIYGGSNEIQRNVIAKRLLGLPDDGGAGVRDPAVPAAGASTDEQDALREVVRDFAAEHAAPRAGYDSAVWKRLSGQLGLTGLAVPERHGGAGAS